MSTTMGHETVAMGNYEGKVFYLVPRAKEMPSSLVGGRGPQIPG